MHSTFRRIRAAILEGTYNLNKQILHVFVQSISRYLGNENMQPLKPLGMQLFLWSQETVESGQTVSFHVIQKQKKKTANINTSLQTYVIQ